MIKRLLLVSAAALLLASLLSACGSKPEYDPSKYVTLEYKYFNGEGVAVPVVTPPTGDNKENAKEIVLLESTRFIYAPDRELSNGDIITVTPVYDEEAAKKQGFKPVVNEVKFTVDGLPEGTPVDLWEYIYTKNYGNNGSGGFDLFFNYPQDDKQKTEYLSDSVNYKEDKYKDLSNGDVVTVTVTYDKEEALKLGYKIVSEPTKEYIVEGLK